MPDVMPMRVPNLLVNGSSGIAVGMATNIPPHNLREVIDGVLALLDDPAIGIDGLMDYIHGPDFPTAAIINGRAGIVEAYRTGRGRILVRARAHVISDDKSGKDTIIITEIPSDEDVIGIVGPNGSGKSNVVDAVRWVLGEQKGKELRLENMGDVIFNGTKKRKPAPVAQVAITFDNNLGLLPSEYQEVVISRHLYRSGESEYLVNKTNVGLMDVKDLLFGTGLGTSSYSVIEQGKMDLILSSKPEDRRYVFEEASGITRYKAKKREAMLKLERTQENLLRCRHPSHRGGIF